MIASATVSATAQDQLEVAIARAVPERNFRTQAPDALKLRGRCTSPESLDRFVHNREVALQFLQTSAHTARHLTKISELKVSAGYGRLPDALFS
jgi:hypothetical protein